MHSIQPHGIDPSMPKKPSFFYASPKGGEGVWRVYKLTLSFFMTYVFVGMFQKWSKMT